MITAAERALGVQLEHHEVPVGAGAEELRLPLRRYRGAGADRAVLLLHGGNSSSDTFLLPTGGFARFLADRGWDVWLLDYRASPLVVKPRIAQREVFPDTERECRLFALDHAVLLDVPRCLERIRGIIGDEPRLSVLGHCLGSGVLSMCAAAGRLGPHGVKDIVLSALGLFYEVPWDGWVKTEDFLLERVRANVPDCFAVDPFAPEAWPEALKAARALWPEPWLRSDPPALDRVQVPMSFLIGRPWVPARLSPAISTGALEDVFGPMHMGVFLHCGQLVRRGFAAAYGEPDVIDRSRLHVARERRRAPADAGHGPSGYLHPAPFADLAVTLVTGAENSVWHRDSVDLMYEWLCNHHPRRRPGQFRKHVLPGYGLQDVFWGATTEERLPAPLGRSVFELLEAGLRATP